MTDRRPDPASPACSAHLADDAYMGFAGPAEVRAFLTEIDADERAGRPIAGKIEKMLPRIRDDGLHRALAERLDARKRAESDA